MAGCDHNCSSCSQKCDKKDFIIHTNEYSKIRKTIGIVSGKGGVGKSLVTSLLAVCASKNGYKSAILDGDILGPSIPKIFGVTQKAFGDETGKYLYTNDWTFTSSDKRFEMHFKPILDRASNTDVGLIASDQHQVFGHFSGTMILDDGRKIELKDFIGFAERVTNKW